MAIWKAVEGYEGLYEVSNEGEVWSHYSNRILRQGNLSSNNGTNYKVVNLCKGANDHKTFLVHRLVAIAFVPNPDNLPEVNHKHEDGDKTRNFDWNLEWTTHAGNAEHSCHVLGKMPEICTSKFTKEQIEYIRNSSKTRKELATEFGVHVRTIFRVRAG